MYKQKTFGFSLLELLVVLAIISIVAAIVTTAFSTYRSNNDLKFAAERGVSMLREARAKSLSSENDMQYGVHFETAQIVLFAGSTYNASDPNNVVYAFPSTIQIFPITLTGGAVDVIFKRLTGETSQDGTVTMSLTADTSRTKTINIERTGLANVQ